GRLARKVLKTGNVDSRIQDAGAPYERVHAALGVAGSTATINDLDAARSIVWIGPDPKETLPVLYLRLRKAVREFNAKLTVVSRRRISLDSFATHVVRTPDQFSNDAAIRNDLGDPVVVCWGPASPGDAGEDEVGLALGLVNEHDAKLLMCPPHAGSQGALDMGLHPALDAGHRAIPEPGLDTRAMLQAAADGEFDALFVFGADPIADFPDAALARAALESDTFTVVVELFPTETVAFADVVLPSAAYAERAGTFTNLERRLQKIEPALAPPGTARDPWKICSGIAGALGDQWGWSTVDDVWAALKKEVPTHQDVDFAALSAQVPASTLQYEYEFGPGAKFGDVATAGPGAQYPKGFRQGAPFQTGQNWPLSWELRAFEARQRPGVIPPIPEQRAVGNASVEEGGDSGGRLSEEDSAVPAASSVEERSGEPEGTSTPAGTTEFILLTGRLIYDEGTMVSKSAALRGLQSEPFVEINDEDAKALDIADGDEVVVTSNGTEARLRAVIADIVRGSVFVPYDQRGLRANTLLSGTETRVQVRKP
ncbi:MAG: molybdopterin-dependent oxidoreductase, partial [Actinomycetota bacterium]|nr:molybdopterin-dependent oxidoreductase [Actinomycetota bacterium]